MDSSILANFANYHCESFLIEMLMGPGRKICMGPYEPNCGKSGRHRVLTRVEFQEMIYRLATLVECSLKFPSASHLICIINGLRGRRKKGRGMGKRDKCESGEKGRERPL